jgi:hypothetical protein
MLLLMLMMMLLLMLMLLLLADADCCEMLNRCRSCLMLDLLPELPMSMLMLVMLD